MKYIFLAFIFFGCKNVFKQKDGPKISTELLDTIKSVPSTIVATPILFESAFVTGTTQKVKDSTFKLYGIAIGKIKVVSGYIIACDPLHIDEYGIPFTQLFPTGEFPVQLSIAKLGGEEMIAFARINFSSEPVERWEFALLKGQQSIPVGGEKMYGYGVDAGIGIFMDKEAVKALSQEQLTEVEEGVYREIIKEMDKHYHDTWKYAMYTFGQHKLAAFSTGMGDGRYATYVGFNAKGEPCRLLTDFGLFNWRGK